MKRPGVRFLRWNRPAHFSRTSMSSISRSSHDACQTVIHVSLGAQQACCASADRYLVRGMVLC